MTPQLRPGLPGYTGPKSGLFAVIHHGELFEYSHDVFERLDYIDKEKPENERKTRRENILYLGECPALAEYDKARAGYDKAAATVDHAAVLSYIRQHIPDFPWDGKQLVFPT